MNPNTSLFLNTLFEIHPKTNLNIDSLPSIAFLLEEEPITPESWVEIAVQYCGLKPEEADELYELYELLNVDFITFLFAVLFKSTVSSRREKILQEDSLLEQKESFEALLQVYLEEYIDTFLASINTQFENKINLEAIPFESKIYMDKIQELLQINPPLLSELLKCKTVSSAAALISQSVEEIQESATFLSIIKKCKHISCKNLKEISFCNCTNSIFYIENAENIVIENCKNCKFYAPACKLFEISSSRGGLISTNCVFLKVERCDEMRIFSSQLHYFVQDCSQLKYSCSNIIKQNLKENLEAAGIEVLLELKQQIIKQSGPLGYGFLSDLTTNNDFLTHLWPFECEDTAKFEFQVLEVFENSLKRREERLMQLENRLLQLKDDEKAEFENECKVQLADWLKANGMSGEIGEVCQCVEEVV